MRTRIFSMWILLGISSLALAAAKADETPREEPAPKREGGDAEERPHGADGAPSGDKSEVKEDGRQEADAPQGDDRETKARGDEAPVGGDLRQNAEIRPADEDAEERRDEDAEMKGDATEASETGDDEPEADAEKAPSSESAPTAGEPSAAPARSLDEFVEGEIPEGARPISLSEAIELALRRHPRLGAAESEVRAAEARLKQSRAVYYPKVDIWLEALRASMNPSQAVYHSVPGLPRLGGSAPANVEPTGSYNQFLAAATVHQLLYDFGRTQGDVGAQKALVEAARMNRELISQSVIFEVTRAFYEVLRKRAELLVAQEGVRRSLRIYELARSGVDAGLRPPSESARAEADAARAELEEIQARAELDIARVQFANTLGGAPDAPYEPVGGLEFSLPAIDDEEAIHAALTHRPELRAFGFRETELKERVRSARGAHFPRLEAIFGMSSRGMFGNSGESLNHAANNWNVGVVMHVPVFQGMRVSAKVDELEAEIIALEANREVIHQAVLLEVKRILARVRSTEEAVRAAQKGLRAARVALDTTEGRYRSGLANIVEMTDAQSAYIRAVSDALSASYEQILAFARLRLAMGQLGANRAAAEAPIVE